MFCPQCGTKNSDTAFFCTNCGNRLKGNGVQTDPPIQLEAGSSTTAIHGDQIVPVSRRTAEDRQNLHTYIVTPISAYKSPSLQRDVSTGVANVATDILGRDLGNMVGSLAGSIFSHFTANRGMVSGTSVQDVEGEALKREALFQQREILKMAASYLERAPWITYLVAAKCEPFLQHFGIATETFSHFHEKALVDEVERYADELETKANQIMSEEAKADLRQMLHLQSIRSGLEQSIETISSITSSEYRDFIEARLRGKDVTIPPFPVKQSDGSVLRLIGKVILVSCGVWFLYLLLLNPEPMASFNKLKWVGLAGIGFVVGGGIYDDGAKRRKLLKAALLAEQQRVESIEGEIARLRGRFAGDVYTYLPEIGARIEDPAFSLESTQAKFRQLIERGDELNARYTET